MTTEYSKRSVVEAGIRLVESGLIARTWGNVSCRTSTGSFVITPSGRDYMSLTPEDIVEVRIDDLGYEGDIKPSSEKGVHAAIYKHYPDMHFVIHTHQENASAMSTFGLDRIDLPAPVPLLGNKVIIADYALPGTKKLIHNVSAALEHSTGQAVIMRNHGVVCFGRNAEEAFQAAIELEKAYDGFIFSKFGSKPSENQNKTFEAVRSEKGYLIADPTGKDDIDSHEAKNEVKADSEVSNELSAILTQIFKDHKDINNIIFTTNSDIVTAAGCQNSLRPYLDDFAQIAGVSIKSVPSSNSEAASKALYKSSAVLLKDLGALCCGASQWDAGAVGMIVGKNCKAFCGASLFGRPKPLSFIDCRLMRFVYQKKYSKQAKNMQKA
ncbi:MAG: class II aldolase/adducin family protein [Clostridiales bacterium]|nr:class II aldolase/adducin family protein [Clostridiales bacterium]